jgi:hypothetical protein
MRKTVLYSCSRFSSRLRLSRSPRAPQNGTLSIREGRGIVQVDARGSMTGRVNGKITITDVKPYDSKRPVVYGAAKTTYRNVKTTVYQGKNIRFRLIGARFQFRIQGRAIFLSAIGRGDGSSTAPAIQRQTSSTTASGR